MKIIRGFFSLALGAVLLWVALRRMPWVELMVHIREFPLERIFLVIVVFLTGLALRGFRMAWILDGSWSRWKPSARAVILGLGANSLIPLRVGEGVKIFYLVKNLGLNVILAGLAVAAERALDVLCLAIILTFAFFDNASLFQLWFDRVGAGSLGSKRETIVIAGGMIVIAAAAILLAFKFDFLGFRRKFLSHRESLETNFRQLIGHFRGRFAAALGVSMMIWLGDAFQLGIMTGGMGLDVSWGQILFAQGVLAMAYASSVSPGAIGIYELMGSWIFGQMGFAQEVTLAMLLILHTVMYLALVLCSVGTLAWESVVRSAPDAAQEVKSDQAVS